MSKINVNNIEANDASTDITVTTGGSQSLLVDTDGKLTVAGNLSVNGNNYPSAGPLSNRNLIINGAMQVAQRGTSFTFNSGYTLDRFLLETSGLDQASLTITQDSDAPSGFAKSLKVTVSTAETAMETNEYASLTHIVEAQNLQHLDYNTADAKSVVLSFWVKSSLAGVYAVSNYTADGSRIIGATYTINSANTWEYKTVTYAGDISGALDDNNGAGFYLYWFLAAGPDRTSSSNTSWGAYAGTKLSYGQEVQLLETASATFQITGVQLEVGDAATPFEHRSYGDELARCQRYFCKNGAAAHSYYAYQYTASFKFVHVQYPVQMRAAPSVSFAMNSGSWTTYLHDEVHWKAYGSSGYADSATYQLVSYSFDAEL